MLVLRNFYYIKQLNLIDVTASPELSRREELAERSKKGKSIVHFLKLK